MNFRRPLTRHFVIRFLELPSLLRRRCTRSIRPKWWARKNAANATSTKWKRGRRLRTSRLSIPCIAARKDRKSPPRSGSSAIKGDSLCLTCHYTVQKKGRRSANRFPASPANPATARRPDWLNIHNDKKLSREERRTKSEAAGMIRPEDIYAVAANCYQCHLVPNEKLVNIGGHTAGSKGFELVLMVAGNGAAQFPHCRTARKGKVNKEDDQNQQAHDVRRAARFSISNTACAGWPARPRKRPTASPWRSAPPGFEETDRGNPESRPDR